MKKINVQSKEMVLKTVEVTVSNDVAVSVAIPSVKQTTEYNLDTALRLHIGVASDSQQDKALQLVLRDFTIDFFKDVIESSDSLESALEEVQGLLPKFTSAAQDFIASQNHNGVLVAQIGEMTAPNRVYTTVSGDVAVLGGDYITLSLTVGQPGGLVGETPGNWWCVLFPPLCIIDASKKGD